MTGDNITAGGWQLSPFGKQSGRTAIRSKDVNHHILRYLNPLGKMSIKRGESDAVKYSDGSIIFQLKRTAGDVGTIWLSWAGEYVNATTYQPGQVVRVSPSNPSIASCTAGLFFAKLEAGSSNYPIWNGASPDTYWELISFYPTELTVCVDGVDTQFYFNSQEVP